MTLKRKCQESKKLKYDKCKWQCVTVNRPGKGWPKKPRPPPKKKKERPGRVEGELHVHGIAAFSISKWFSCSSVLILRTSRHTTLLPKEEGIILFPTAQPSAGLISVARKLFLMIFYLVDIYMFLRYQAEFHSLASDPLPKHPLLTLDQVPMTLTLVLSLHTCHNWVRCWAEGGNYSPKSILPF